MSQISKNIIIVTGGAGFVGTNLIAYFLKKTNNKIISLDNYSSGTKKNHIKDRRVIYLNSNTKNISKILKKYIEKINSIFHFGEFSRIYQSFLKMDECINSNVIGTNEVFNFCFRNKIKLIYSATSATIGNQGADKNLSPYAFTKAKNLEMLENFKNWYKFKFEVIYFYNVYGPRQISSGKMATVIGIFEDQYRKGKPLTVVKPGTQTRRFTHIHDTVKVCFEAWKKKRCAHYSISNRNFYSIKEVAKMFNAKIKVIKARPGERFASSLTNISKNSKIINKYGKLHLKDYITSVIKG